MRDIAHRAISALQSTVSPTAFVGKQGKGKGVPEDK